jgi:hypothetical protein
MEVLRAHAAGEGEICIDARAGTGLSSMIGDGDELVPPEKCPNCGSELHADQEVCPQCGHMRALPTSAAPSKLGFVETPSTSEYQPKAGGLVGHRSAGGNVGAAFLGCGSAFLAAILCMIGFALLQSEQSPAAIVFSLEAVLAVLLFLGFRAIIGRNRDARPALYAFVIVFVVLFGGLVSCIASLYNVRVQ